MERLLPPAAKPIVKARSGTWSKSAYAIMAFTLLGGAWVRFNPQITRFMPEAGGPASAVSDQLVDANRIKALVDMALVPAGATQSAVAAMSLPAAQAGQLALALRRGKLRLVRMPLLDLSPAASADAGGGRAVSVSTGGYTRLVTLTRAPTVVTLPVGSAATVSFRTASSDAIGIGAVSLTGLVRLPDLPPGGRLDVGIIAQ